MLLLSSGPLNILVSSGEAVGWEGGEGLLQPVPSSLPPSCSVWGLSRAVMLLLCSDLPCEECLWLRKSRLRGVYFMSEALESRLLAFRLAVELDQA